MEKACFLRGFCLVMFKVLELGYLPLYAWGIYIYICVHVLFLGVPEANPRVIYV